MMTIECDNEFVKSNLGLVHACCKRFKGKGIEYDELYSVGCLGLVKASKAFDEKRGVVFSTYAVPVILGELRQLFRQSGIIKVGRSTKELQLKIKMLQQKLENEDNNLPSLSKIADILEVSTEKVIEAVCCDKPVYSLDEYDFNASYDGFQDTLCDKTAVRQVISKLEKPDRQLIYLRFFEEKTQTQTAEILNITQVQVSRKERSILKSMKKYFE